MNSTAPTTTSSSNFRLIIDTALDNYKEQTGIDLTKNELGDKLQHPDGVLEIFQERENQFKDYRDRNRKLINFLKPAVQVIHALSGTFGEAITIAPFPPAKAIFVGIDVLLAAASGVSSSYDALEDLFECIQNFLKRLHVYTEIPPTDAMTYILVKVMIELLSVLALATKQIKQGRFKKFAKKLLGESEVESVLQRLDRLTQEEARMTVAQTLEVVHGLMSNMRVVMDDGKASMCGIRQALVDMQETASKINKMERDQLERDVRNWLSPPDPSSNQNIAREAHQTGTAAWFFEENVFSEWAERGSLLWIHGKPGSGKSILLSAIIHDIECLHAAGLACMAYYYFDFRDAEKQHRHGLLASLLTQLSSQSNLCYDILSRLYATHKRGMQKPADATLTETLKEMLELPGQGPIYIIVDAIDECPNTSGMPTAREKVLDLMEKLVELDLPNVHICVTSRPEIDIRTVLEPLTTLRVSLHDENGQQQDIVDYVTKVVRSDRRMRRWRDQDKQLVINVLSEKADGMFRWVFCQLEVLRRNLPASIKDALKGLPETLDETYKHALLSIDKAKREYAQRLFQCLTVSIRPLRVAELAEVLAIRFEAGTVPVYDVSWRLGDDAEEAVLSVGSSLISVVNVDGSQVVQFSHFSVKEFLTSNHLATLGVDLSDYRILPGPAHMILAKACLSILLKLDDRVDKNTIENLPLAQYAARHWVDHAQFGDVLSRTQDLMERLFDPEKPHFAAWIWLYDMDRHWKEPMSTVHPMRPRAVPLYYAALCGFHGLVEHLIKACPSDVNARGGHYKAPLHAALGSQYLEVMTLLLQRGAEVDVSDKEGSTPLHRASKLGALDIMQLPLKYGADVNAQNAREETPLDVASGSGEIESARLLLQCGAVVDCRDEKGWTPLHKASRNGHLDVIKLLSHSGAVIDARNGIGETPLDSASSGGHVEISHFLIEQGADINARDDDNWVPLHFAAHQGHVDVARLLLDRHVDVNVQEEHRQSPLHLASAYGHLEMAKLLVRHGASIDIRNDKEETPLDLASDKGHLDIARYLVESGANVSSRCSKGWTPFHTASKGGHLHVAEFLLQSGVNVDVRNGNEDTALDFASGSGKLDVVQFLIEHGADVKARDNRGWNPLHVASGNGHLDVALLLLDCGADPNVQKDDLSTPLHLASAKGDIKIVRLLVERGASVNSPNDLQETALHKAAGNGDIQVSRFLLDAGANLHALDKEGWTPLHKASFSGHLDVVKLLLRRGADIDSQNRANKTAAHLASDNGKTNVASFLAEFKGDGEVRIKIRSTTLDATVRDKEMTDYGEQTTLHRAVEAGEPHIVEWFLERGADVNARDAHYRTPLDLATTKGNLEITQLLLEHGAEVDSRDDTGWTPLHNASRYGHLDIARLLIGRGADVDARKQDNWAPLHLSAGNGYFEIVELLLSRGSNIHHRNDEGLTAFQLAARKGHRRIIQLLMENGAR